MDLIEHEGVLYDDDDLYKSVLLHETWTILWWTYDCQRKSNIIVAKAEEILSYVHFDARSQEHQT